MSAVAYLNLTVLGEIQHPGSLKREGGGWDEQGQVPESTEPDSNRVRVTLFPGILARSA